MSGHLKVKDSEEEQKPPRYLSPHKIICLTLRVLLKYPTFSFF